MPIVLANTFINKDVHVFSPLCVCRNVWCAEVCLPDGVDIKYRYAVCIFVQSSVTQENNVVVRRWETALKARKIGCHGKLAAASLAYILPFQPKQY